MYSSLSPTIQVESQGSIRIVRLNRPEKFNAVDAEMHTALSKVWRLIAADPDARGVLVTGNGTAFSGGGDMDWFARISDDAAHREGVIDEAREIVGSLLDLCIPIVAAINGPAMGLGCSIAMMADVVMISEDTYIGDPHVAVGLVAGDGGVVTWPLLTSMLRAKEYLLTGDRIPAEQAERFGMVNYVVAPGELQDKAMAMTERLAALPSQAVRNTKRALNLHVRDFASRALDYALQAESESFTLDEHKELVAKFKARRR